MGWSDTTSLTRSEWRPICFHAGDVLPEATYCDTREIQEPGKDVCCVSFCAVLMNNFGSEKRK
jgi:hypothetical protein